MIREVNVCAVGEIQSGISQSTGNPWRKLEFVVEWHENTTDTQSQKVVLSIMGDYIDSLDIHNGDKLEVRFDLGYRQYNGRYYQNVFAPAAEIKKLSSLEVAAEPQPTVKVEEPTAPAPEPQPQAEAKADDLPF
jgi:hypothetical protein